MNLIPFPGLDGCQFLIALIEQIKGKRIPEEHINQFNAFGMALLLILMGVICIQDVSFMMTR